MEELKNMELNEQEAEKVDGGWSQVRGFHCNGIEYRLDGYCMYTVADDDWLSGIANYYGTTVDNLMWLNRAYFPQANNTVLYNPNLIHPGDHIIVG